MIYTHFLFFLLGQLIGCLSVATSVVLFLKASLFPEEKRAFEYGRVSAQQCGSRMGHTRSRSLARVAEVQWQSSANSIHSQSDWLATRKLDKKAPETHAR